MKGKFIRICALTLCAVLTAGAVGYAGGRAVSVVVNDKELDTEPVILNDRVYIPLRAVGEALGLNVSWDGDTKTAYINSKEQGSDAGETAVPAENTADGFAYKLNALMPENKNYMFSPLSIKLALALAANGAQGDTRQEILSALDIEDIDEFNTYVQNLIERYSNEDMAQLRISDSIWLNTTRAMGIEFDKAYADKMKEYYNAEMGLVSSDDAVSKINKWCSESTNGKIDKIIDSPDFLAALVNAVYFKGTWSSQFNKAMTSKQTFTGRDGSKTDIDFMHQKDRFGYYEDGDVKMLQLAYRGSPAMYIILNGDKPVGDISEYIDKIQYCEVDAAIPKFNIKFDTELNDMLSKLGINTAFDDSKADFMPMFGNKVSDINFYIDKVLHKTYIDVDENGTEAAAVTAVMVEATALMPDLGPKEFVADKPFTFVIADGKEILFMGEYAYAK